MTRTTTWRRTDVRWCAAAAAVIVGGTALVLTTTGRDDRLEARPGEVVPSRIQWDAKVHEATLRIPTTALDVTVTDPVTDAAGVYDLEGRGAPEDGSFVGVEVAAQPGSQLPYPVTDATRPDPSVSVALVVGDETYPVPADPLSQTASDSVYGNDIDRRRAWVAVAGTPRDVRVAVTFDGVTQTVDPRTGKRTGARAAALYDLDGRFVQIGQASTRCRPVRITPAGYTDRYAGQDLANRCEAQRLGRLPYLPGRGWAPSGSVWFAAYVAVDDDGHFVWRGDGRTQDVRATVDDEPRLSATVDGRPAPADPLPFVLGSPRLRITSQVAHLLAVPVPVDGGEHDVTLSATYRATTTYSAPTPGAPIADDVTMTWTVTL